MCHLLGIGTTVKSCSAASSKMSVEELKEVAAELKHLDDRLSEVKQKRLLTLTEAQLPLPKRNRMIQSKLETVTKNDMLDMEYARLCVMSMCRSTFMDSSWTSNFFSSNFNYEVPSRRKVMRDLIPLLYKNCMKQVKEICGFNKGRTFCTLSTDGWQSPDGQHLRNYMIVLNEISFLHSTTCSGTKSMNAEAISEEIIEVIDDIGPDYVASLVTDNASSETTAWDYVMNKHEDVLCSGCCVHGGNLLFKDVTTDHKWSKDIVESANALATFIRSHTWTLARVKEESGLTVTYHCMTRFAGAYYTMHRLMKLKDPIRAIFSSSEYSRKNYERGPQMYTLVMRNQFWENMDALLAYLQPLKNFIRLMDATRHMTEHVIPVLNDIETEWSSNKDVPPRFVQHTCKLLRKRAEWISFDCHRAAYALSPEYHGDDVSSNVHITRSLKKIVEFYCHNRRATVIDVMTEFSEYKERPMEPENFPSRGASAKNLDSPTSLSWWSLYGAEWPLLQEIAIRVFSMGSSSSTSERNWSTFGNIWNRRSSGYTVESASMICAIKYNTQAIFNWRLKKKLAAAKRVASAHDEAHQQSTDSESCSDESESED